MAQKRNTEPEIVVSGASPARPRRKAATATNRSRRTEVQSAADSEVPAETAATQAEVVVADSATVVAPYEPSHSEIAELAYSYWEARGYQGGSQQEDWQRAEE